MHRVIATFIIFYSWTFLVSAQRSDSLLISDTLNAPALSEVVVTSNRTGSLRLKTPEAIRGVDIRSIERMQLRTAPEALLFIPGVFVQKTNHGGGSPFIRGLTGNQTLLLIDGIRLNNATFRYGPNQYFNTIDVFSIEKLEVMRGSGSVQYGSDALGGTIQVLTPELKASVNPDFQAKFLARTATHNMEQSLRGQVGFSNKKLALRTGITARKFGNIIGGDTTGRQSPTEYSELDYDVKGKLFLTSSSDLTAVHQSVFQTDVPVYHKIILENYAINRMNPQKRDLSYLRFNKIFSNGILNSIRVTASLQKTIEVRESRKNASPVLRTEKDKVRSMGFSSELFTKRGTIWSAGSGLEVYSDKVGSTRFDKDIDTFSGTIYRGLYPDGSSMTSLSLFSIHTFELPQWIFTSGIRYNSFLNKVADEYNGTTKLTPQAVVGNISILRKIRENSTLFVSANSGFRAPNIDDLGTLGIVDFRYEMPNLGLKPENSLHRQIGYKYQDKWLRAEIYLYRNDLYNLISRSRIESESIDGYPVFIKENIERAFIRGAETSFDLELSDSWIISGNLAYAYGKNITRNEPVRRIPPLNGRLALEYNLSNLWLNIECHAAGSQTRLAEGDRDDNRIPEGGTPGWQIFNINGSYSFKMIRADVSILNILNRDYRYHGSGINGYGRSVFLSISVTMR